MFRVISTEKKSLFTIQVSQLSSSGALLAENGNKSTNVVNSSLISFPFLLFRYLDICTHVAAAT